MASVRAMRRDLAVTVALLLVGQALIQVLGAVIPALVRYPGPWRPTLAVDSIGYLETAADLSRIDAASMTKVAYLALLGLDTRLGLGGWLAVVIQVVLLGAAGLATLRVVGRRFGRRAGFLAACFVLLNPQVTQWTKVLLTESIFIASTVLLSLFLASVGRDRMRLALVAALSMVVLLTRPNGVGAVLGVVGFLSLRRRRLPRTTFAASAVVLVLVIVLTPFFQSPGGDGNTIAARTYEGLVIWAYPNDVRIGMPEPSDASDVSNAALVGYAIAHPIAIARLAGARVLWELIQVRPHYPSAANIAIAVQMLVTFALVGVGVARTHRDELSRSIAWLSFGLLLAIAGTWAIAEGRFGWALMTLWAPWFGVGLDRVIVRCSPQFGHPVAPRTDG